MSFEKRGENLKTLKLTGGSLKPFLKEGDLLLIDVKFKKIRSYDLVSFLKGKKLITHIAMWKGGKLFLYPLHGKYFDGPLELNSIAGKVVKIKRGSFYYPLFPFKILFFLYFKFKGVK